MHCNLRVRRPPTPGGGGLLVISRSAINSTLPKGFVQKLCQLGNSIPSRSACRPAKPSPAQPSLSGRWAGRAAPAGSQGGCRAPAHGLGLDQPTNQLALDSLHHPVGWLAIESYPGRSLGLITAWVDYFHHGQLFSWLSLRAGTRTPIPIEPSSEQPVR